LRAAWLLRCFFFFFSFFFPSSSSLLFLLSFSCKCEFENQILSNAGPVEERDRAGPVEERDGDTESSSMGLAIVDKIHDRSCDAPRLEPHVHVNLSNAGRWKRGMETLKAQAWA
jgi:hypothetical protein